MTTCEAMSERMPAVARGEAHWSEADRLHLEGCAACGAEWRLVGAAPALGAWAAARVDPARVAGAVLPRVRAARRATRWRGAGALVGLATAALLLLLVWTGRPAREPARVAAAFQGLVVPLAELDGLDAGQLEMVLDGLDAPITEVGGEVPRVGELEDQQLERVLRSLEG